MDKRRFLKIAGAASAGTLLAPSLTFCTTERKPKVETEIENTPFSPIIQAPLPYGYAALEPFIDAETMEIHYSKHHAGYTRKLNEALEMETAFQGKTVEGIFAELRDEEGHVALRNNGGGYYNHNLYWQCMTPGSSGAPNGEIAEALNAAFGSYANFKDQFSEAAKTRFGSGWAWLSKDKVGGLFISSTPNQDNPLMSNLAEQPGMPLLGIDVWEHAYYLKHQNKRADYISAFFEVINWETVAARFAGV